MLQGMIKQRRESIELYEQGRPRRAGRRKSAARSPSSSASCRKQMAEAEIEAAAIKEAIAATGAAGIKDMGRVMAALQRNAGNDRRPGIAARRSRASDVARSSCSALACRRTRSRRADRSRDCRYPRRIRVDAEIRRWLRAETLRWLFRRVSSTSCAARVAGRDRRPRVKLIRRGREYTACARSTTRRRRPSASSRTRASITASVAARMATSSASSCRPRVSTSPKRSSSWPARPGSRCRRRRPRSASGRSAQRRLQGAVEAACAFFEEHAEDAGRQPRRATICAGAASTRRRSGASAWAMRPTRDAAEARAADRRFPEALLIEAGLLHRPEGDGETLSIISAAA